jgi:hypothetical protein
MREIAGETDRATAPNLRAREYARVERLTAAETTDPRFMAVMRSRRAPDTGAFARHLGLARRTRA